MTDDLHNQRYVLPIPPREEVHLHKFTVPIETRYYALQEGDWVLPSSDYYTPDMSRVTKLQCSECTEQMEVK